MKEFNIPEFYKSPIISVIKNARRIQDPRKKDFSPTLLDFGPVRFLLARHFGFCYGVENAIEIAFKAVEENPGKRIFLLSQMIHNPGVNKDLIERGVRFLMDTLGNQLIPWEELNAEDIVIIPAFGTTLEIQNHMNTIGIEVHKYNTTCPFVEKVWSRAEKLGMDKYSIIIHGKHNHEETRATFSRSEQNAPSIVLKDMAEAKMLGAFILGELNGTEFYRIFNDRCSAGFQPEKDLQRIGVINQTTMLASDTQGIADYFKQVMIQKYGALELKDHFADTRDTLCYATNENQDSTYGLLEKKADLAIVVGGYNSSNTSHLVDLCELKLPTYFISSAKEISSAKKINHFNYHKQVLLTSENFLPAVEPVDIMLTSGASCPDAVVDEVLQRIVSFFPQAKSIEEVMKKIVLMVCLVLAIGLSACKNKKYEMYNMMPMQIDISDYVNSGEFEPDSCRHRLNHLKRKSPLLLDESREILLQIKLKRWIAEYNRWLKKNNRDTLNLGVERLFEKTRYQYSYLITDKPVDVYRTDTPLSINGVINICLFIQLDEKGDFISDYDENNFVDTPCDSVNSRFQDIYSKVPELPGPKI